MGGFIIRLPFFPSSRPKRTVWKQIEGCFRMKNHLHSDGITLMSFLLVGVIVGLLPIFAVAFDSAPSFDDPVGDQIGGVGEDAIKGWVDNNDTHLLIKIEFVGAFTAEDHDVLFILIGVNTAAGTTNILGHTYNFTVNYILKLTHVGSTFTLQFNDTTNLANNLSAVETTSLAYFINNSAAHTVEIGYQINTASGGKGNMAIALGQTIKIQTKTWLESDLAPNNYPFSYQMKDRFTATTTTFLIIEYGIFALMVAGFLYSAVIKHR